MTDDAKSGDVGAKAPASPLTSKDIVGKDEASETIHRPADKMLRSGGVGVQYQTKG